jgi:hypothetical protein
MSFVEAWSDTVLFEVVDRAAGEQLAHRLRPAWRESLHDRDRFWLLAAELRPVKGDLAVLLRKVEAWVATREVPEIWFSLDGRSYLLKAGELDLAWAA